ncbi:F0F1 ATP synthase subunit B [Gryllotalpicola kribbensis]|jgi:F-type H+-transporting ATPase subunit b|uniref:ATP synthase subunit b n=1 Tax=Gryllotalpicola kribbensis TaxID=993084 RepID=A0ABP8AHC7_9MICO
MVHAVVAAAEASTNPLIPEWSDLIWAALCFVVVVVFFVWKFIPSFTKLLDDRAAAIEGNIAKADEAQNKAEALLEQYTAQLADARSEAASIKEQAREEGKRIVAEQKEQAAIEAARVTQAAQAQIEAERKQAATQLRSEVGTLAIDLASGVIGETLKDDAKAAGIVDRFLAELEASEGKAGAQA